MRLEARSQSWGPPPRHRLFESVGRRGNSGREVKRLILWLRCQRWQVHSSALPMPRYPRVLPGGPPSLLWISCLYLFRAPRRKAPSFLPGRLRARGGSISDMRGMRTRCLQMQSWLLGPCRLSYGILTLRRRILCSSGRLWPSRFRERLWSVQTPLLVHPIVDFDWSLPLSRFCRWLPT